MLIGLVNKPFQPKLNKSGQMKTNVQNEEMMNPFHENMGRIVQVETEEHSQKFVSIDKMAVHNLSLKQQTSSITNNKTSALNMFLQETNDNGKEHIIDLGNQVLYIGIIGKGGNSVKIRHAHEFWGSEESRICGEVLFSGVGNFLLAAEQISKTLLQFYERCVDKSSQGKTLLRIKWNF